MRAELMLDTKIVAFKGNESGKEQMPYARTELKVEVGL